MKGVSPLVASVFLIVIAIGVSAALLPQFSRLAQEPLDSAQGQTGSLTDCAAAGFRVLSAYVADGVLTLRFQNTGQKPLETFALYVDMPKGLRTVEHTVTGSLEPGSIFLVTNESFPYVFANRMMLVSDQCPNAKDEVRIQDKALMGHWSFDESGVDNSGKGHDATLNNGASIGTGVVNGALVLDGVNDWARISGDIGISAEPMTLEFWFNTVNQTGDRYLFDNRNITGTWWFIKNYGGGNPCTAYPGNICFENKVYAKLSEYNTSEWTHLAVTINNTRSAIYINGVLLRTGIGEPTTINGDLRIGTRYTNSNYFNGSIDELRLYERVLNDNEILATYEAFRP